MSNTNDSFIDEVTEEVRRDKLFGYMRRYGWIAVLLILLLVGGTAWKQWRDAQAQAKAQALGDQIFAAMDAEDPAARADALAALDVTGQAAAPKLMLEAATLQEAGKTEAAAGRLKLIADDEGFPRIWRDLASLKRVMLLGQGLSPEDRLAVLAPMSTPGAPYRVLAREQEALARYELGEIEAALTIFNELIIDQDSPSNLRSRAEQMRIVLEGLQGAAEE